MVTSRMLESYCTDIERLLREGTLRPALRLSVALPDICAALEDAQMQSSSERYTAWCAAWLSCDALAGKKPISGARLYRLYTLHGHAPATARARRASGQSMNPTAAALGQLRRARRARRDRALGRSRVWQPANRLQAFQVNLTEALVKATRQWYREQGTASALVQANLGRLLISG